MVSLAATTFYTIVCWLTGFLAGTAFWEVGSLSGTTGDLIVSLLLQLLGNFAYTSLFFLIAVLFKKNRWFHRSRYHWPTGFIHDNLTGRHPDPQEIL